MFFITYPNHICGIALYGKNITFLVIYINKGKGIVAR